MAVVLSAAIPAVIRAEKGWALKHFGASDIRVLRLFLRLPEATTEHVVRFRKVVSADGAEVLVCPMDSSDITLMNEHLKARKLV